MSAYNIKKGLLLLLSALLFMTMLSCFVSLYRNVFFYISAYFPASRVGAHDNPRIILALCLFNLVVGQYAVKQWGYSLWLKLGMLAMTVGFVLSAMCLPLLMLLGGGLVMSGVLMSLPALVYDLTVSRTRSVFWRCLALLGLLIIDRCLLTHIQSLYAFREWCLAFAVLLTAVTLVRRLFTLSEPHITLMTSKHLGL